MAARKEEAMTDNMHPSVSAYATQHMRTRSNSNVTPEDVKPNLMPRHSRKHSGLLVSLFSSFTAYFLPPGATESGFFALDRGS